MYKNYFSKFMFFTVLALTPYMIVSAAEGIEAKFASTTSIYSMVLLLVFIVVLVFTTIDMRGVLGGDVYALVKWMLYSFFFVLIHLLMVLIGDVFLIKSEFLTIAEIISLLLSLVALVIAVFRIQKFKT